MVTEIEDRVAKLLDQLENPGLTVQEIEKVEQKIRILQELAG